MDAGPLVQILRAWLAGERPLPRPPAGIARVAERHRLTGTLYHIGAPLFEVDAAAASSAWTTNLAGHLHRMAALARAWPRHAPPPLVIKGADAAEHLFDDPGARRCSDLDLLLPDPDFEPVAAALGAAADEVREPRSERFADDPPYERGFRFGPALIELHRHPQPPHRAGPCGRALWRRGQPARLGDVRARQPHPDDRLLLWLTNQAKQSFHGDLADLLDLALILRRMPEPSRWTRARRLAEDAGLGRPLRLALVRLAQSGLWPDPLPALDDAAARLVNRALPHPVADPRPPTPVRFQALKLWLADDRARRAIAHRGLHTLFR
jgi:hypothetical protein